MTNRQRRRTTPYRFSGFLVTGLLVAVAAIAASLGDPLLSSASSTAPSGPTAPSGQPAPTSAPASASRPAPASPPATSTTEPPRSAHGGPVGQADGILPERATVFDTQYPGIANLDPDLLRALRRAATKAAVSGIELYVDSGWRSARYQELLLREAISKYGSEKEAARWVATPTTSPHVSGDAVDIGPSKAAAWLSQHGSRFGLCQIYRNEPWHYELRPGAVEQGCPRMYADPTHDPRMQG